MTEFFLRIAEIAIVGGFVAFVRISVQIGKLETTLRLKIEENKEAHEGLMSRVDNHDHRLRQVENRLDGRYGR